MGGNINQENTINNILNALQNKKQTLRAMASGGYYTGGTMSGGTSNQNSTRSGSTQKSSVYDVLHKIKYGKRDVPGAKFIYGKNLNEQVISNGNGYKKVVLKLSKNYGKQFKDNYDQPMRIVTYDAAKALTQKRIEEKKIEKMSAQYGMQNGFSTQKKFGEKRQGFNEKQSPYFNMQKFYQEQSEKAKLYHKMQQELYKNENVQLILPRVLNLSDIVKGDKNKDNNIFVKF